MRKILIILTAMALSLLVLSTPVYAVNIFSNSETCGGQAASTSVCNEVNAQTKTGSNPVLKTLKSAIEVISFIIGIASVIVILIAGFRFIIANGDAQSITNARNTLLYALAGVAVAVLAETIVVFVLGHIG